MPCRYLIDAEHGLVISTAWDRVTFAEVDAHQDRLASDPSFNPDFKQLVDATRVTDLDISIDEAKAIFGRKTFSSASRCAFLGRGLIILGMGRLIEAQAALAEGRELDLLAFNDDQAKESPIHGHFVIECKWTPKKLWFSSLPCSIQNCGIVTKGATIRHKNRGTSAANSCESKTGL